MTIGTTPSALATLARMAVGAAMAVTLFSAAGAMPVGVTQSDRARAAALDERAAEAYDGGDTILAAVLWRQAAYLGQRDAMTALGSLLEEGDGLRARPDHAQRWYARAALHGEPHAMVLLAEERLTADPADPQGAILLSRAATLGHPFAQRRLAELSGDRDDLFDDSTGDRP